MGFPCCWCFEKQDSKKEFLLVVEPDHASSACWTTTCHSSEYLKYKDSMLPSIQANNDMSAIESWSSDKESYTPCSEQKLESKDTRNSFIARDDSESEAIRLRSSDEKSFEESLVMSWIRYRPPVKETISSMISRFSAFANWKRSTTTGRTTATTGRTTATTGRTTASTTYRPYPMSRILPHLYLGNMYDANDELQLKEKGITHILSLASKSFADLENIRHCPMNDSGRTSLKKVLDKVLTFIEQGQRNGNTLLIHCQLGQNRSATVVIAFLMMKMKYKNNPYTLYRAHKEVKAARPLVLINREYAKQLLALEKELRGKNSLPQNWMEQGAFNEETGDLTFKYASLDSEAHYNLVEAGDI